MALVSSHIATLSTGVSQQPAPLRLPTACERLENAWPSMVSGLQKRPPTEHIATMGFTVAESATGHIINRANGFQYIVVANQDDIKVIGLDGVEYPVDYPVGRAYLSSAANPVDDLKFLTYGDFTFVLNRRQIVKQDKFGETGVGGITFTPDYSVDAISQLPTGVPANASAYVVATDSYYRYELQPGQAGTYAFNAETGWISGQIRYDAASGKITEIWGYSDDLDIIYTQDSLPATGIPNQLYAIDNSVFNLKPGWNNNIQIRVYRYVVVTPAIPANYQWVKRPLSAFVDAGSSGERKNPDNYATVYVTTSIANSYYSIYINNVLKASFLTKNGTDASNSVEPSSEIASELRDALVASGYTATVLGSTISISNLNASDTIRCVANSGDKALRSYRDVVQQFTDLPPSDVQGRIVRVDGTPSSSGDDYYVIFDRGIWKECEGWNQAGGFHANTMPHTLIRNADNTFTFKPFEWGTRTVGDEDTNADPSFVSRTINDIFVYANRLGFLADENVILSEADNIPNFYRKTVAQLLDDDRIDVAVVNKDVSILAHAIPFAEDLLLLSDKTQYKLQYSNYLSAKNIKISYSSSFNASTRIKPVNMESSVYFVDDAATYSYMKLMEMFVKDDNAQIGADDVTSAVPEYVPANIRFIAASPRMRLLLANSAKDPKSLYVYKFFWADNQKVQNAWSVWKFNDCDSIHWAGFLDNYAYVLVQRGGQIFLEKMKVDEDVFANQREFTAHLDRRIERDALTLSYDSLNNDTTVTLPYATAGLVEIISSNTDLIGFRNSVTRVNSTTFKVKGNLNDFDEITVGVPYTFLYEFSRQYMKNQDGKLILEGRLQMRYMSLEFHNTAYFQFTTTLPGRDPVTNTFNSMVIGDGSAILGQTTFSSGTQRIPLMGNASEVKLTITNDGPFGNAFGAAEWQAVFTPRSRRIN